ncbi:MAG: prolipoprotein diacylglyceryl transferase [Clostridia bacterium]|nr:prolipoprotein diacylglyceryl transferase [Clostridia bacterium]
MDVTIFSLDLTLNPIAFSINIGNFSWNIYWYGIIIALGFLLALIYGYINAGRFNINLDRMLDIIIVTVPVAILSARTYYLIFDGEKLESIGDFFGFGDSSGFAGLAIYGAVIGAALAGSLMCKLRKVNIPDMLDLASLGFLIGQGVGRWGNFVNQEAFGTLTGSSWWGMESVNTIAVCGKGLVHPCFLYESIWCITGFFILNHFSKKRAYSGQIALMYCAWYGFGRAFIELLRTDSLMLGAFRVSSLLSFMLCAGAVAALVIINKKQKAINADKTYIKLFENNEEIEND